MSVLFHYEEKYERVRLLDYFKTGIPSDAYTREIQEKQVKNGHMNTLPVVYRQGRRSIYL